MCGIGGMISKGRPIEDAQVTRMTECLRHRGPDDIGYHRTPTAQMGMTRLAILDLVSEGLCPLVMPRPGSATPVALCFNGEIFNYVELREELIRYGHCFRTRGDGEVLLRAYFQWGEDCLERLNGMFAFAILDAERDLLFLARDRAGEKPLYYHDGEDAFCFASEIKALLTVIPEPEVTIPDEYRAFEYTCGEQTLFEGVRSLPPGHKLVRRGVCGRPGARRVSAYWEVSSHLREVNPETAVDELDALLHDSVRIRLRSDVPLGLYLSGGIDSSILAYMARPAIAFSCQFPYGPKYDELEFAELVAKEVGCDHVVVRPTQEDFTRLLPDILYALDMPVGSFSIFPLYMLAREATRHVKIVLSGEGADELFSGYTRYLILPHEESLATCPPLVPYRPLLHYYYGNLLDRFARLLNRGRVSDEVVKSVIAKHFLEFDDLVHAMGYTEFKLMLVTLLQMEDRTAAAFGLENRSPFLDHRIIEFAFSIPGDFKVREMTPKWIVREVAKRYLPRPILDRQDKMGLIAPINLWLGTGGRRGEYDRQEYNRHCFQIWQRVFFQERRYLGRAQG